MNAYLPFVHLQNPVVSLLVHLNLVEGVGLFHDLVQTDADRKQELVNLLNALGGICSTGPSYLILFFDRRVAFNPVPTQGNKSLD